MQKMIDSVLWLPKYLFLAHYVIYINFSMSRAKYLNSGEAKVRTMQQRLFPTNK